MGHKTAQVITFLSITDPQKVLAMHFEEERQIVTRPLLRKAPSLQMLS